MLLKSSLLIGATAIAAGGLYAGGAFDRGKVYELPIAEARSRLATLDVPPMVKASAGGSDAAIVDVQIGSDTVRWKIRAGTGEPAQFTASLETESPSQTHVKLGFSNGRIDGSYADRIMSTSFMRSYAETAFAERVDARLEGRAADDSKALQEFAQRAAADPSQVQELGEATRSIFSDVQNQMAEMNSAAEQREPTSRESIAAATRPSMDFNQTDSE